MFFAFFHYVKFMTRNVLAGIVPADLFVHLLKYLEVFVLHYVLFYNLTQMYYCADEFKL